uniref:Transposase Tc1-like domain-containing protein n=1 Tax=Pundamilia nyererei TaxID=303518 RepID=A0A3B4HC09_9CICH
CLMSGCTTASVGKVTFKITVSFTNKRLSDTGANSDRKRSGRPKTTTELEDKFLRNSFKHISTVKRRLRPAGLTSSRKMACWAMKHRHWTTKDWKMNQNFESLVHHAESLYAGWLHSVWHQLSNMEEEV